LLKPEIRTGAIWLYNEDKIVHIHLAVEGWIEKGVFIKIQLADSVEKGRLIRLCIRRLLVNAAEEFCLCVKPPKDKAA